MDAETRAVLENIARDVREMRHMLMGNGNPDNALVGRLMSLELKMDTQPCSVHDKRLTQLEKFVGRAMLIYGAIIVSLGALANAPNIVSILRKLL